MPALIGLGLALAVAAFGRIVGMDRDRAFYPVILIVVAHYYILFAAIGGASEIRVVLGIFGLLAAVAVVAFRKNLWFGVVGLAGHGVFDVFHRSIAQGSGVPSWWPSFCLAFDVAAAACLALLLIIGDRRTGGR